MRRRATRALGLIAAAVNPCTLALPGAEAAMLACTPGETIYVQADTANLVDPDDYFVAEVVEHATDLGGDAPRAACPPRVLLVAYDSDAEAMGAPDRYETPLVVEEQVRYALPEGARIGTTVDYGSGDLIECSVSPADDDFPRSPCGRTPIPEGGAAERWFEREVNAAAREVASGPGQVAWTVDSQDTEFLGIEVEGVEPVRE